MLSLLVSPKRLGVMKACQYRAAMAAVMRAERHTEDNSVTVEEATVVMIRAIYLRNQYDWGGLLVKARGDEEDVPEWYTI